MNLEIKKEKLNREEYKSNFQKENKKGNYLKAIEPEYLKWMKENQINQRVIKKIENGCENNGRN